MPFEGLLEAMLCLTLLTTNVIAWLAVSLILRDLIRGRR